MLKNNIQDILKTIAIIIATMFRTFFMDSESFDLSIRGEIREIIIPINKREITTCKKRTNKPQVFRRWFIELFSHHGFLLSTRVEPEN